MKQIRAGAAKLRRVVAYIKRNATADEELQARLNNLPRELYDIVQSLVFTPDVSTVHKRSPANFYVIKINKKYKPPAQLQVDSASRAAFSWKYYSHQTVVIFSSAVIAEKWLTSLSRKAVKSISKANLACIDPLYPQLVAGTPLPPLRTPPLSKWQYFCEWCKWTVACHYLARRTEQYEVRKYLCELLLGNESFNVIEYAHQGGLKKIAGKQKVWFVKSKDKVRIVCKFLRFLLGHC